MATADTVIEVAVLLCRVTVCAVEVTVGATPPKSRWFGVNVTLPTKVNDRTMLPSGTITWPPASVGVTKRFGPNDALW